MIGQEKLIEKLDHILVQNKFPRFSIILAERGMEHEDVARYVANYISAEYIQLADVKVDTIRNMIKEAYNLHNTVVYCIPNADDMSINAKNALLKVVEDVPNKAYFIMCLEDLSNSLATIESRAEVFRMSRPTSKEIEEYVHSINSDIKESEAKLYGDICSSAGDVLMLTEYGVKNFYSYAEYIADNIMGINGAEVFTLSEKISTEENDGKWDCKLFLRCLQNVMMKRAVVEFEDYPKESVKARCHLALIIGTYAKDLRIKGINKRMLLDNMWLEMRREWKYWMSKTT